MAGSALTGYYNNNPLLSGGGVADSGPPAIGSSKGYFDKADPVWQDILSRPASQGVDYRDYMYTPMATSDDTSYYQTSPGSNDYWSPAEIGGGYSLQLTPEAVARRQADADEHTRQTQIAGLAIVGGLALAGAGGGAAAGGTFSGGGTAVGTDAAFGSVAPAAGAGAGAGTAAGVNAPISLFGAGGAPSTLAGLGGGGASALAPAAASTIGASTAGLSTFAPAAAAAAGGGTGTFMSNVGKSLIKKGISTGANSLLGGGMSSGKKQTVTTQIPAWLDEGGQQAVGMAQRIAQRPVIQYGTDYSSELAKPTFDYTPGETAAMQQANQPRYAPLDPNEQTAYNMATQGSGYQRDLNNAEALTKRASGTFTDANMSAYMNPYIKGALDPAARELRQSVGQDIRGVKGQAANAGAFGGSRATLLETETRRGGQQALGDLYSRGYASAFENASQRFDADRNAAARGAEQYRALGSQRQQQFTQDMGALMTTGGMARDLQQKGLDFNFQKFTEARDWDVNNLKPLLAAISSTPYGGSKTSSTGSDSLSTIVGLGIAAYGAFSGGGGGADLSGLMDGPSAKPSSFYNVNPTFTPAMVA